jgi:zinc protease
MGWATVRPEATSAAVEEAFLGEVSRLASEEISPDELQRAKALIETDELGSLQRVSERADRLSMYATLLDDPGEINRQLERYLGVTAADVRAACGDLLVAHNRVVLTYIPAAGASVDADGTDDAGDGGTEGGDDGADGTPDDGVTEATA